MAQLRALYNRIFGWRRANLVLGAYCIGWFASDHFSAINDEKGIHIGVGEFTSNLPGIHLKFLLIILIAIILAAIAGALIGLPTLRLRGDYIAIVTLAFGAILRRVAINGASIGPASRV